MKEFRQHIEEAIVINLKRLPRYASLSYGYSVLVSIGLIFFELCIWPMAFFYDWAAEKWYREDRRVLKDDFISMKEIGHWQDIIPEDQRAQRIILFPGLFRMRFSLFNLLIKGNWAQAHIYLTHYRDILAVKSKGQLFLYLHFIESIHRSIRLTQLWCEREDQERKFLIHRRGFVLIQTIGLEYCLFLDLLAYPLYKKGIGIIVNDIPKIPLPE
jgi:hypothetical protein